MEKVLTKREYFYIIVNAPLVGVQDLRGGIAQLARAFGSYPECHWFESNYRYQISKVLLKIVGYRLQSRLV